MPRAFLFDLHARPEGIALTLIDEDGTRRRLLHRFTPSMYLAGPPAVLDPCRRTLQQWSRHATVLGTTQRRDFWTGQLLPVLEVRLEDPHAWHHGLLNRLYRRHPDVDYHNADLLPEQHYCFLHDLVPLGHCVYTERDGEILHIERDDDEWDTGYTLPDLVTAELDGDGQLHGGAPRLDWLSVTIDGRRQTFDGDDPRELLRSLDALLAREDPDILLTSGGDSFLLPLLLLLQQQVRDEDGAPIPLRLDREPPPRPRPIRLEGRSYFSYGRVLYQAPDYALCGRWHLDTENSFMVEHTGLHGLVEVARVSKLPVQRIGRRSVGTGITSIQLNFAFREGFLIPWKKTVPEAWKTADQLLATDRGGLVYQPLTGAFENVVEIDFVSMYPTIMSRFNVSPETVNCRCCENERVPEIGYTICEKREGLVARALAPIIDKRVRYKAIRARARADGETNLHFVVDARQTALKWLLVCCFGYLGYRNARFGRIEAHEAVCAFARDRLLTAREVCERHGFRVLHAIVDCFWCQRDPAHAHLGPPTPDDIRALCDDILAATDLPIALEGVYRWIAFLPSRVDPAMPVPNRFFGRFEDGSVKMRGIEARRHDLPPFHRDLQKHAVDLLATAGDLAGYRALVPELLRLLADAERALRNAEIPRHRLLITRHLSMDPAEYRSNNMVAFAARQGTLAGIPLRAGQTVTYLIVRQKDRDPLRRVCLAQLLQPETGYDPDAYIRLLRRAFQTLLLPAGIDLPEDPPTAPNAPATEQTDLFAAADPA